MRDAAAGSGCCAHDCQDAIPHRGRQEDLNLYTFFLLTPMLELEITEVGVSGGGGGGEGLGGGGG